MVRFRIETRFKESEIGQLEIKGLDAHYLVAQGVCGKIPLDWEMKKINDDYEVNTGRRVSPNLNGSVPVYGASGFSGYSNDFITDGDTIVTGRVGTLGQFFFVKNKADISDNALYITTRKRGSNLKFLYYFMKNVLKDIDEVLNVGTSQPLIKQSEMRRFLIPFPREEEKSRITDVLTYFDDLIENKEAQNNILGKTAIAVFRNWFINFEPFKDGGFQGSLLGEIPKGWEVKPIGDIANLKNGFPYTGKEKFGEPVEGGHLFITLNNVTQGGGFKPKYFWIKTSKLQERHLLDEGDLIMTNIHFGVGGLEAGRLMATPALVTFPFDYKQKKAAYSMDITRILPLEDSYKFYLYLYLVITREDSVSFSTGTGVLHLDIKNFKRNKMVVCPPSQILAKFASLVQPLFQKIASNQKQIAVLRKIRDTLLPLLVFGKLRVDEV
jgi:type I restriction enzyme S subunit